MYTVLRVLSRSAMVLVATVTIANTPATAEQSSIAWEALTPKGSWVVATQDDQGVLRTLDGGDALGGALALRRVGDDSSVTVSPFASLHLADGQVLAGGFVGFIEKDTKSLVRWKHPGLGLVDVAIEQISEIHFEPTSTMVGSATSDRIILRNGDVVEGFVESFGDTLNIDVGGMAQEIPLSRVSAIWLVSKVASRSAVRVWIADGSVIDGASIEGGPGGSFILSGADFSLVTATLPLLAEEVVGIEQTPYRVHPLSSLTPTVAAPTTPALPRANYPPPSVGVRNVPLSAATIEVRGPERLVYEIPQGFTILSADIALASSLTRWGNCALIIRQSGEDIVRLPLSATTPHRTIMVPIGAGRLEIEIDEASGGPVGDTVILRRAILIAPDGQS